MAVLPLWDSPWPPAWGSHAAQLWSQASRSATGAALARAAMAGGPMAAAASNRLHTRRAALSTDSACCVGIPGGGTSGGQPEKSSSRHATTSRMLPQSSALEMSAPRSAAARMHRYSRQYAATQSREAAAWLDWLPPRAADANRLPSLVRGSQAWVQLQRRKSQGSRVSCASSILESHGRPCKSSQVCGSAPQRGADSLCNFCHAALRHTLEKVQRLGGQFNTSAVVIQGAGADLANNTPQLRRQRHCWCSCRKGQHVCAEMEWVGAPCGSSHTQSRGQRRPAAVLTDAERPGVAGKQRDAGSLT